MNDSNSHRIIIILIFPQLSNMLLAYCFTLGNLWETRQQNGRDLLDKNALENNTWKNWKAFNLVVFFPKLSNILKPKSIKVWAVMIWRHHSESGGSSQHHNGVLTHPVCLLVHSSNQGNNRATEKPQNSQNSSVICIFQLFFVYQPFVILSAHLLGRFQRFVKWWKVFACNTIRNYGWLS